MKVYPSQITRSIKMDDQSWKKLGEIAIKSGYKNRHQFLRAKLYEIIENEELQNEKTATS